MCSCKCCSGTTIKSKKVNSLAAMLKIVAEESRLKILCILLDKEHCVCEIMEQVRLSQSLISHHLKDLKDIGIIKDEKRGLFVHYSLTPKGKDITNLIFKIKV